mgnify:CR=1 FL=1
MQIEYEPGTFGQIACDNLVVPIFEGETAASPLVKSLDAATGGFVRSALASKEFKPERNRVCRLHNPRGLKARSLLLVGAGSKQDFRPAGLRELAGTGIRAARSSFSRTVAFLCRGVPEPGLAAQLASEGALYADYESNFHKTRDREDEGVRSLRLLFEKPVPEGRAATGIHRGSVIGEATNYTRKLVDEPSNILTPSRFAELALEAATGAGLAARVLDRREMEALGMHALLAVSRGSAEPPKMVILETAAAARRRGRPPLALVGKGVTFDSGGISLKPPENMHEMKGDMAGGAAVLGAMVALARLGVRKPVLGVIPLVENMPGGRATRPGDVVRSFLGKTIEIVNTDAEGRLILADALHYARTQGAGRILDIATLTGACVVALGHVNGGMMGTDQKTMDRLRKNCPVTGEGLWQLPLCEAYRKAIRSDLADVKNVGDRWGGAITAAKFLQEFAEETPWVHLDIAGMDFERDGSPFACKGSTGFGVRTMVCLAEQL